MELEILDQAIEAYFADTLDDERWQEVLAIVQKIIS
jgi:hypothetical protein